MPVIVFFLIRHRNENSKKIFELCSSMSFFSTYILALCVCIDTICGIAGIKLVGMYRCQRPWDRFTSHKSDRFIIMFWIILSLSVYLSAWFLCTYFCVDPIDSHFYFYLDYFNDRCKIDKQSKAYLRLGSRRNEDCKKIVMKILMNNCTFTSRLHFNMQTVSIGQLRLHSNA